LAISSTVSSFVFALDTEVITPETAKAVEGDLHDAKEGMRSSDPTALAEGGWMHEPEGAHRG
jgi:hypothetical protein